MDEPWETAPPEIVEREVRQTFADYTLITAPIEQRPQSVTHESSSVGARPSSAAPVEQNQLVNSTSWGEVS
jgi:hypothetical protein